MKNSKNKLCMHKNETIYALIHTFISGKISHENDKLRCVYKFAKENNINLTNSVFSEKFVLLILTQYFHEIFDEKQ